MRGQVRVAKGLLPVLDDLDRAEKHGDLEAGAPFAAIAGEAPRRRAAKVGLRALRRPRRGRSTRSSTRRSSSSRTPGATEATVLEVVETGYRLGSVELRPAKVVVAVPAE